MANKRKQVDKGVQWFGRNKKTRKQRKNGVKSQVTKRLGRKFDASSKKDDFPSFSEYMAAAHKINRLKNKVELSKGSLVWARYQNWCPWPAIVKNVYRAKKRASIVWLPAEFPISECRTITLALTKVEPFVPYYEDYCIPFSILTDRDLITDFYKARQQARTINDQKIDPFTAQHLPESVAYNEPLDDTPTNLRNIEAESQDDNDYSSSIDPESSNSEQHNDSSTSNFLAESTEQMDQENDGFNAKILEIFKSEEAKDIARQLMDGSLETARTKVYAIKAKKRDRRSSMFSIPADRLPLNDAQLEEAVEILETLYEPGTDVNFPFIFEVMIPELVKFALRKLFDYSEEEAENSLKRT